MAWTNEEILVFSLIQKYAPLQQNGRVTQLQIMRSAQWLGSHPQEAHLNINHEQSTLRKIRQIIRNLRLKHGCMILSDANGYWIMKDKSEAEEYLKRIEKMAAAQARSWLETYQSMKNNFGIKSEFFERNLFNQQ